jgi:hypothetical protein
MNRINQQLGQIKWFADHLQLLQSEPMKAIDQLFAHFPSCVVSGCEADGTTVKSGLISFVWTDAGVKHNMIVPFDGATGVTFPKYFILEKTNIYRNYENGGSKIFSQIYKAVLSDNVPSGSPSIQIQSNGASVRLLDAIQSASYRFATDSEKNTWNAKLNASDFIAANIIDLINSYGSFPGVNASHFGGQLPNRFVRGSNDYASAAFSEPFDSSYQSCFFFNSGTPSNSNPTNDPYYGFSIIGGNGRNDTVIMAIGHVANGGLFYKQKIAGAMTDWVKVWTDLNHGPGSGLDADKLDGKHASEFLSSVASIVPVTQNTTLIASDMGKIIEVTGSSDVLLPAGMPTGSRLDIVNIGTGTVSISAQSGNILSKSGNKLYNQYGGASCYHRGSNNWVCVGDLAT